MNLIKSRWIAAFLLVLLIVLHAGTALAVTGVVNTSALILREKPSADSKALQTLRDGEKFDIIYEDDGWYKVKYGKYTGYVMAKYVKASGDVDEKDDDSTLRIGSKGEAVKDVQRRLKELGYYKSSIDGDYGSVTASAVKAFQQKNGLTADGVCGEDTLKKLNSSSAKGANDTDKDSVGDDDGTLRIGSKGEAVKEVQRRLKELGYYKSSIDGSYGSVTASAVKAFQQKNGLTADGVCDEDTLKKLNSSSAKGANDTDKDSDEDDDGTLRIGSKGEAVKDVQRRLKELGYYKSSIDGDYGSVTASAVKAFQQKNGLTADGVYGEDTLKKLNSSSAKGANDTDKGSDEDDDGTLRIGSKGEAVKDVQRRLKELGYYKSSIDGSYGSVTASAVKAFQQKNGLTADGVCDEDTLKKLNSSSAKGANDTTAEESLKTNQTLSPGDDNAQVKAMQIRLKELGYYTNTIDGEYGNSTKSAVKAFQKNNGLTQNGIADEATLEKMVSSSALGKNDIPAGTYVTERLDWFKDGVGTFPRNATIQIKDCKTGLIFKAKVLYGSNHLDAEPLTAADTDILLDINGGVDFSYRRRSVLVQYNGHVYAASIYCEPHGDQTITNNNFDGQFCLHFYGSKTHGSDRVDEDHKECEALALKYTW